MDWISRINYPDRFSLLLAISHWYVIWHDIFQHGLLGGLYLHSKRRASYFQFRAYVRVNPICVGIYRALKSPVSIGLIVIYHINFCSFYVIFSRTWYIADFYAYLWIQIVLMSSFRNLFINLYHRLDKNFPINTFSNIIQKLWYQI